MRPYYEDVCFFFKAFRRSTKSFNTINFWKVGRIGDTEKQLCIILVTIMNKKLKKEVSTIKVKYTFRSEA